MCITYRTLSRIILKLCTLTPLRTFHNTLPTSQRSFQLNLNPLFFQKLHQQTIPTTVLQHKIPPLNPRNTHHPTLIHLSPKISLQTVVTPPLSLHTMPYSLTQMNSSKNTCKCFQLTKYHTFILIPLQSTFTPKSIYHPTHIHTSFTTLSSLQKHFHSQLEQKIANRNYNYVKITVHITYIHLTYFQPLQSLLLLYHKSTNYCLQFIQTTSLSFKFTIHFHTNPLQLRLSSNLSAWTIVIDLFHLPYFHIRHSQMPQQPKIALEDPFQRYIFHNLHKN